MRTTPFALLLRSLSKLLRLAPLGLFAGGWVLFAGPARAEMALVMVEQPGCIYCKAWNEQISAIYPLTDEGKAAPLTRVQLRAPLPEGMAFARPAAFTPTFVLLRDGAEIGRIEGYPGEDFFWGLLAEMLREHGALPPG